MKVARFLEKHDSLLRNLDERFRSLQAKYPMLMQCGRGCAQCCHGLFDVSLPDALRIAGAFGMLSNGAKSAVMDRALAVQARIIGANAWLSEPCFLSALSQEEIDEITDRMPDARCPLLDERDQCLLYDQRPLACRLEGIPMVDAQDGLFGDWCELNFRKGVSPELAMDLRLSYYEIQATEEQVTGQLSKHLFGDWQPTATVFIPSVIVAFEGYWKPHLAIVQPQKP